MNNGERYYLADAHPHETYDGFYSAVIRDRRRPGWVFRFGPFDHPLARDSERAEPSLAAAEHRGSGSVSEFHRSFAQAMALESAIQEAVEARVDLDFSRVSSDRSANQWRFDKKLEVLRRTERRLGVAPLDIPEGRS